MVFFRKRRLDLVEKDLYHFKYNLGAEYLYFWADTFLGMSNKELDEITLEHIELEKKKITTKRQLSLKNFLIRLINLN